MKRLVTLLAVGLAVVVPGSYALQRGNVDFLDAGAQTWDVFDAEGRFVGVVTMPDRFSPLLFVGNQVFGVWRDDLDVDYVMRARIEGT